jgi:capsule polysaccharide export protein KpsE/RkpR
VKDLIPTEEEFETIIEALGDYSLRIGQIIATEEVLKATQRIADRDKAKSENEKAFEVFDPKKQADDYMSLLEKEIDRKAILEQSKEEGDKLTLVTAKVIRLRDECRKLGTDKAIEELLK